MEQLFMDVIKSFSEYKKHIPQLKINILEANIHIVAVSDNYLNWGANSLDIIGSNHRYGHKFRASMANQNCRMCLLYRYFIYLL